MSISCNRLTPNASIVRNKAFALHRIPHNADTSRMITYYVVVHYADQLSLDVMINLILT